MKRILLSLLLLSVAACRDAVVEPAATPVTPTAPEERPVVRVALLGATSGGSALPARRALQGARLAFDQANDAGDLPFGIEGVASDTKEDPLTTSDLLSELEKDGSYRGAIVWESPVETNTIADFAANEGFPALSVSPAGAESRATGYTRIVASDRIQAEAAAEHIAGTGVRKACVAGDSLPRGAALATRVRDELKGRGIEVPVFSLELPEQSEYSSLVEQVAEDGCKVLYWSGGGTEGGVIVAELAKAGAQTAMVGADPLIGEPFLLAAEGAGEGTVATCSCVDVSVSTDLEAQRFVQDYQSKFGNPPSAYAVEGWDAANIFIDALGIGSTRVEVNEFIGHSTRYSGLGGKYSPAGDTGPRASATFYEVQNQDWVWLGVGDRAGGR